MAANLEKHADPVVPDQAGRLMPADPMGINSSVEHVKRKFNVNAAREDVVRQRHTRFTSSKEEKKDAH